MCSIYVRGCSWVALSLIVFKKFDFPSPQHAENMISTSPCTTVMHGKARKSAMLDATYSY